MPRWSLSYRRKKLHTNNFKPVINYNININTQVEEKIEEVEEIEFEEIEDEIDIDLESLFKDLEKIKNTRKLELFIKRKKTKINNLENSSKQIFLTYINELFF